MHANDSFRLIPADIADKVVVYASAFLGLMALVFGEIR